MDLQQLLEEPQHKGKGLKRALVRLGRNLHGVRIHPRKIVHRDLKPRTSC